MDRSVLVVEDNDSLRDVLTAVLFADGFAVSAVGSAEAALEELEQKRFDLILSDLRLPQQSGMEVVRAANAAGTPVVVMTAYGSIEIAVEAMKLGAADFLVKPFDPAVLHITLREALENRCEPAPERAFLTQSTDMQAILRQAEKVAPLSCSVVITGESGTGKELIARRIHSQSPRREAPFVAVNCASMPSELLESEFFGHEAGAFTGATEQRLGLFEVASGGTIFLDEIGTMPFSLQVKLLRVLQESEIRRIGSTKTISVDTRVICATNVDLDEEMRCGRFREDLYYRLGVFILELPPLRDRPEDIELLASYFLKKFAQKFNRPDMVLSAESMEWLLHYPWPGNVRELENLLQRTAIFAPDGPLLPEHLNLPADCVVPVESLPDAAQAAMRDAEIRVIKHALAETHGNKLRAAKALKVSYKTLLNKVKEYGL